jgi:hypothetical protein
LAGPRERSPSAARSTGRGRRLPRRLRDRRRAPRRGAAALAGIATLKIAGGEALIASLYSGGVLSAVVLPHWLSVGRRVLSAGFYVAVALGARTAAEPAEI